MRQRCVSGSTVCSQQCVFLRNLESSLDLFLSQKWKCKRSDTFGISLARETSWPKSSLWFWNQWLIYNINVLSGSMKTFLLLSHHTGDLHMHFIVSQGGQIVHISSTYSSTYNMKLLLSDLLWNVLFLYNYRPAYQRPWQPVPIKFNFHNFSRIKS